MRFIAGRAEFTSLVLAVAQGLPVRPNNPAHMGMLVHCSDGQVQLTASDGDTTFNGSMDIEGESPGSAIFPRIFPETVKSLTGKMVELNVTRTTGILSSGRSVFSFSVEDEMKYPFPQLEVPELGSVDGPEFRDALKKVLPAASRDNPVPALTAIMLLAGENIQGLQMVATDKYALAHAEAWMGCGSFKGRALLPVRHAEQIARMDGEMKIGWDDNRFQVRAGKVSVTCRQVDAKGFPEQWKMILSMGETWTKLPDDLLSIVRRAALPLADKEAIYLDFGNNILTVSSEGKAGFTESCDIEYDQGDIRLKVSHEMLKDALAWCDEVTVGRPLVFRGENCRYMVQVRRE